MRKEGTKSVCSVCGSDFYVPPSHRRNDQACSRKCRSVRQVQRQTKDLQTRFWAKVDKSGDCWVWTASLLKTGYGCIRINKTTFRAHRIAYEIAVGPIPDGALLRHTCDNPKCVNPSHLLPGTHKDNVQDALERGQMKRGEEAPNAKLSALEVETIRAKLAEGVEGRTLARQFDVSEATISVIKNRKRWT